MEIIFHTRLNEQQKIQYDNLLEESKEEPYLYGKGLVPALSRQVIVHDNNVVGCFESGQILFENKMYHRTNRPYTAKAYRGKGLMFDALQDWYSYRRPAMCWIDDDNQASIALFTRLEFIRKEPFFHKEKDGHIYILDR